MASNSFLVLVTEANYNGGMEHVSWFCLPITSQISLCEAEFINGWSLRGLSYKRHKCISVQLNIIRYVPFMVKSWEVCVLLSRIAPNKVNHATNKAQKEWNFAEINITDINKGIMEWCNCFRIKVFRTLGIVLLNATKELSDHIIPSVL